MDAGSILFGIGTLFLGLFLRVWYTEYIRRPVLQVNGGGVGGAPVMRSNLSVTNTTAFVGINIGPSMILGRPLHSDLRRGLVVDRNPAKLCHARLIDKASGRFLAALYWRSRDNPERYEATTTIPSGESAMLMLFARLRTDPTKYFLFQPDTGSPHGVRVPDDHLRFTGDREFELQIGCLNGRTLRCEVGVRMDYNGHLYIEQRHERGGGSSLF